MVNDHRMYKKAEELEYLQVVLFKNSRYLRKRPTQRAQMKWEVKGGENRAEPSNKKTASSRRVRNVGGGCIMKWSDEPVKPLRGSPLGVHTI